MKLYDYFRSSAAYRVRIALNLKGVAPERAFVHLRNGDQRADEYLVAQSAGPRAVARDRRRRRADAVARDPRVAGRDASRAAAPAARSGRSRARALARARDRLRHPSAQQPARAELPDRDARRDRRAEERLVQVLDRRRVRGARDAARARAAHRPLLPRRRADDRRHLPRAADGQRAPRRVRLRAVSDADAHRGRVPRAARVRRRGARRSSRTRSSRETR